MPSGCPSFGDRSGDGSPYYSFFGRCIHYARDVGDFAVLTGCWQMGEFAVAENGTFTLRLRMIDGLEGQHGICLVIPGRVVHPWPRQVRATFGAAPGTSQHGVRPNLVGRQPLAGLAGAFWRFERACGRLGRRMPAGTQALSGAGYAILTTSTLPTRMVSGPLVSTGMPFTTTLVGLLMISTPFCRS